MTRRRPRSPGPATTDELERGRLRAAYIERFVSHENERAWLAELAQRHRVGSVVERVMSLVHDEPPALVADAEQVLRRLCLDRLDDVRRWELRTGIMEWLVSDAPVEAFSAYAGTFGWTEAPIGDVEVGRELIAISPSGRQVVGIIRRPLVRVILEDEWNPAAESRQDAQRRLLPRLKELLDEELDRIERHARELGYRFPDTRPNVSRDLDWLVWRVRDRRKYKEIANLANEGPKPVVDEHAVRKAVRRLAELIGVALPEI